MIDLFVLFMPKNFILNILRLFFCFLDYLVYTVSTLFFRLIFNLANIQRLGIYESIEERVYIILGIFMLFKVTISLITYLVNPDKISDKEQGVSKVVVRIMMVLVMLIGLPTFFDLMTEAQNKLLPVLPRVIIGTANTLDGEKAYDVGNKMAVEMLQGFAHLKEGCTGDEIISPGDLLIHINDSCSEAEDDKYAYDYFPVVSTLVGIIMWYVLFSLCIAIAIRTYKLIILKAMAPIPIISYIDPKSSKDGAFSHWSKTLISTWAELFIHLGIIYFVIYIIDFLLSFDAWR